MNKHLFVSATKGNGEDTVFKRWISLVNLNSIENIEFKQFTNNTKGLSQLYNEIIEENKSEFDYIHFIHDDAFVYDNVNYIIKEIEDSDYDISGVAGAGAIVVSYPSGWYDLALKSGRLDLIVGHIEHKHMDTGRTEELNFSNTKFNHRTVVIDGVYMCVRMKNIGDWKFNEHYTFHHYDIASCIDAVRKGLKIGVVNLHLRHELQPKPLIIYNPVWIESDKKFRQEYTSQTFTI